MIAGQEPLEQIDAWIEQCEVERQHLHDQVAPLLRQQALVEDRLLALQRLRTSYGPAAVPQAGLPSAAGPTHGAETTRARVQRQVRTILEAADGPMHVADIHREFQVRGWAVPGAGLAGNITAHLSGSPQFISVARGTYRLAADGEQPEARRAPRARKTTKRGASR